jgi:hypothetical protein
MRSSRLVLTLACTLASTAPGLAVDRWEAALPGEGDDTRTGTANELRHGAVQSNHDFDGPGDVDWAIVLVQNRHSYEVRVSGGTAVWQRSIPPPTPPCTVCGTLDVLDASDAVVAWGVGVAGITGAVGTAASSQLATWTATADGQLFVRASSGGQTGVNYDLEFRDTTYRLPRFNNSGTQATILILQNTSVLGIIGQVHFLSAAGWLLHTETFSLTPASSLVLNTSTIPALQNASGSALVTHPAPYGTLAGKAVALEPATGFTFDTPLEPIPY